MTQDGIIPVLAAPYLDPGAGRVRLEVEAGQTLAGIVAIALPMAGEAELDACRVALVTPAGQEVIPRHLWSRIRPRPGVHVVIRVVPQGDTLRSVLSVVVMVAATAIGNVWGPALASSIGIGTRLGTALVTVGVSAIGALALNALIPPSQADEKAAEDRYSITGWRNSHNPDGAVPVLLGSLRVAPPFAALNYTEIVGDWMYIRSVFCLGYGRVEISDIRIGETSIDDYDEVELEIREGVAGDDLLSLYPGQVAEETIGAELTRPLPRDDSGEIVTGDSIETPVIRSTGADAASASVILSWPAGLVRIDNKGRSVSNTVSVRIEQRAPGDPDFAEVTTLTITAKKLETFYRQHTWDFPSRGRWQVRLTMLTDEARSTQDQRRTVWAALQTIRPEYPIDFPEPLALISARVKATHQINGQLDNLNVLASRICLDYDHTTGTWIERATSNPAALFIHALQSPANPRPVTDIASYLDDFVEWHDMCRLKGLKYDAFLEDTDRQLGDALAEIAAAGRASPRWDGLKWGVVIDRPQEIVAAHINPLNSYQYSGGRTYTRLPDAFRVQFLDATNDFESAERYVRRPGHTGDIVLTELLELPGKTDPDEIWREGLRRFYELMYRPDAHQVMQDNMITAVTRGDLVMLSYDTLDRTQRAARVVATAGLLVTLDQLVTMEAGEDYAIRFRVFADDEDAVGSSVVRQVQTVAGDIRSVQLLTGDQMPEAGDIVHFGVLAEESAPMIVSGVEQAEDSAVLIRMVDAAPAIDALVDAAEIPAWDGRFGGELNPGDIPDVAPAAPVFASISTGTVGTGDSDGLHVLLSPGTGSAPVASYRIEHQPTGDMVWASVTVPAADGGAEIAGYVAGDAVDIRAVAISAGGTEGPYGATVSVTIGAGDPEIPTALDGDAIDVTGGLGAAVLTVGTTADAATVQIQLYRVPSGGTLDRATHAVGDPFAVTPLTTIGHVDGDGTRTNLLADPGFDDAGAWTADAGWAVSAGVAQHTPGTADAIGQALSLTAAATYRYALTVSGRSAGSVTPQLTGGSTQSGPAISADGQATGSIVAATGNTAVAYAADSDFDGAIDDAVLYLQTSGCVAAGAWDYYLEPQNEDGVPGPASGPFAATII